MNFSAYRFLRISVTLPIWVIVFLSGYSLLALGQEPAPVEINIVPQADYAVASQPFTYTIVMTNVSPAPVSDVIMFTEIPGGTTFIETHRPLNWLFGGPGPAETGMVVWNTLEPIAKGQVITFDLVVDVLPAMVNQQLVSKEYTVISKQGNNVIGTAPSITTQVLAAIPTPTLSPTATATNTPLPPAANTPAVFTISTPQPTATATNTVTPPDTALETTNVPPITTLVVIGLSMLLIGTISLSWVLKRK